MLLSGDSMRRMLQVGAWHRRNGERPPAVQYLIKWQHGPLSGKRKAEDDTQGHGSITFLVQHDLGVMPFTLRKDR